MCLGYIFLFRKLLNTLFQNENVYNYFCHLSPLPISSDTDAKAKEVAIHLQPQEDSCDPAQSLQTNAAGGVYIG